MIAAARGHARWLMRGHSGVAAIAQTMLAQVALLLAYVVTGVISARALGPAGRGELAAISLIPNVVSALLTFGLPAAVLYHLKRSAELSRELTGAAIVMAISLGVIAVGVCELVIPYVFHQYDASIIMLARWFVLVLPLTIFTYVGWSVFESAGDFWYANRARLFSPLLTLVMLVVLAALHRVTVLTAGLSYALPNLPVALRNLFDIIRRYKPRFSPAAAPYRMLTSYGLRSYGSDILKLIGTQFDQILVVAFLPPAQMGLYSVSLSLAWVLQIVQNSVSRVLLPRVSAQSLAVVVAAVGRSARVAGALTALACVALIVLGPFLLHLFYGDRFAGATGVVRVLAIEAFFAGTTAVLVQAFLALGRPGTVTLFQSVGIALSVPLMIVLIPRTGLIGAAVALLIATLVRFAVVLAAFPALLHIAPPALLLGRADIRYVTDRLRRGTRELEAAA